VGGCGVAGDETDTPALEFELGPATVTVDVALVAVLGTACVWAAGADATVIRPARDVADAALPVPTESELTDKGFCAAGRIICGYCGKEKMYLFIFQLDISVSLYQFTNICKDHDSKEEWHYISLKCSATTHRMILSSQKDLNPHIQHCENLIFWKILSIYK